MKSIIQKLYNLCMEENDRTDIERLRTQGDDLCKKKREDAYQSYQKLRSRLTGELAEELDVLMDKHLEIFHRNWKTVLRQDLKQEQIDV